VIHVPEEPNGVIIDTPPLSELQKEEELLQQQEETELQVKREAAIRLASERGLGTGEVLESEIGPEAPTGQTLHTPSSENNQACKTLNTGKDVAIINAEPISTNMSAKYVPPNGVISDIDETETPKFVPARLPLF
jgi:hypothetical protein